MKKFFKPLIVLCATALLTVGNANAAEYNLKLQSYYGPAVMEGMNYFAKNVEDMSGGRIKIQVFSGGELVSGANILKSVRSGMIDIGLGVGHFYSEMQTGTLEAGLPLSWSSATDSDILFNQRGLHEILEKEYDKAGVVYLGSPRAGSYCILTKTPVSTLDELRKLKIRAVGACAKLLTSLGVSCVNTPSEDTYLALTTGQIDGALFGNAFDYKQAKFYEVAEYLNLTPLLDPLTDSLIINKKLWDKFPDDLKAIVRAAAAETNHYWYTLVESGALSATEEIFKGKTTTFSPEDQKVLFEAAVKIWDEEAKRSPAMAEGVEILKQFAREKGRL